MASHTGFKYKKKDTQGQTELVYNFYKNNLDNFLDSNINNFITSRININP